MGGVEGIELIIGRMFASENLGAFRTCFLNFKTRDGWRGGGGGGNQKFTVHHTRLPAPNSYFIYSLILRRSEVARCHSKDQATLFTAWSQFILLGGE